MSSIRVNPLRGRRPALVPALAALAALLVVVYGLSWLWTSWLWFKQLGFGEVFRTRMVTQIGLFLAFAVLMGAVVGGNLLLAHRFRPKVRVLGRRDLADFPRVLSIWAPTAALALMAGLAGAGQADTFLAWRNATPFGQTDAWFGRDVSFYVFDLPWYRHLLGQLMAALICAVATAGLTHLVHGAMNQVRVVQGPGGVRIAREQGVPALTGPARTHLSALMALLLLGWACSLWLDRFGYATSNNSLFTGIGYTDHHNRIAAKDVMVGIAIVCAILFAANTRLRRWPSGLVGLVLALISSIVVSGLYPAFVQRFQVRPDEPSLERPYIEANIDATRSAYDIDDVRVADYDARTTVSAGQLKTDAEALPGVRLIDPALMGPAFEQLQQVKGYYSFPSVLDVDRYTIDGQFTDAVVAAREIDLDQVPDRSWNNLHTFYTHGYGMVAAYGNRRQASGEPDWIAQQIPTVGPLKETESRIYFGERSQTWSVVGAPAGQAPVELDTPGGGAQGNESRTTYAGTGGVGIGNPIVRAMFAARYGDINLLLSERVNDASRILFDRTPRERVQKVAPWLTLDSDTYPAVVDGRIVWIVDGYTTSANYPNSNRVDLRSATSDAVTGGLQAPQPVNYMRNAVKAVVDAYDGTVDLYAWDEDDPMLQTWQKAYPGVVKPRSAISADLLSHMRYPQDLFKVQRQVLGRYHTTDASTWYQKSDLWEVPNDPVKKDGRKEAPNYLSIKWPGDSEAIFSQTAVFVPKDRENLAAYVAVDADASSKNYGRIRVLKLSDRQQIAGPGQTYNAMMANETVATRMRNYVQGSAAASYGNLLTLPIGGGLLYVEPIYTQQQSTSGGYPVLRFVVVRFGEHIGIGDTLQQALDMVFVGDAGADTGEGSEDGSTSEKPTNSPATGAAAAQALLREAATAFSAADAALKKGDLATYQKQLAVARAKVAAAQKALR